MKVGIWFVGVRGSIATTVATGLAVSPGGQLGLITESPPFSEIQLPALDQLVIGGSDTSAVPLRKVAEKLATDGVFPHLALKAAEAGLDQIEARIRPGIGSDDEMSRASVDRVIADLDEFRSTNALDYVVVVNVSTTEPEVVENKAHESLAALDRAIDTGEQVLPPSSMYAYAAFASACSYVDFTPSIGARLPALRELAKKTGVPFAGNDGKTGETLVKTALAPMFRQRNLKVRSWAGINILGGGDGMSLAEPDRKQQKLDSKAQSLDETLGYKTDHPVHIDYVEDMGQWKTAWNHVSFEGFLGTKMSMQFTWQGCDSTLAAPLVIDLVRLTAAAHAKGISGAIAPLAFFFKDPIDSKEHSLSRQFDQLSKWATDVLPL